MSKELEEAAKSLASENARLRVALERIGQTVDPNYSTGGDVEWLVSNYVKNVTEEMERLRGNQKPVTPGK